MARQTAATTWTSLNAITNTASCMLCDASFVKVPAWFTVSAAIKVATAKRVSAVLIDDPHQKVVARLKDLKSARPTDMLARWARDGQEAVLDAAVQMSVPLAA